jgi:polysaccharide biosynthesis/export protein
MRQHILAMMFSVAPVLGQAPEPGSLASPDYIVGAQDVLLITSYDQPDLTGTFAVDTDGTFSFPMVGRLTVGGLTLREVEASIKKQLVESGFFINPQITVAVSAYRSQRIFIVGEVRPVRTRCQGGCGWSRRSPWRARRFPPPAEKPSSCA